MFKKSIYALAFASFAANAQTVVPAIDKTAMVVPVTDMPSPQIQLTKREEDALAIAREWRNNPDKPRRSEDGTVVYLFGATLPTLICTPLKVCAIRLQPGELINNVHVGDTRWTVLPSMIGSGPSATANIIAKPLEYGVTTNVIITTDRRVYTIMLKSARHDWMSAIAFDYPDDQQRAWAEFKANQDRVTRDTTMPTGENAAALDFDFTVSGDSPKWKPQRVYTDGVKTYIQFPSAHFADEAPALVAIGKGNSLWSGSTTKMVNYRLIGDRYVVDEVLSDAALISGVGNGQTKVTIQYVGGKQK